MNGVVHPQSIPVIKYQNTEQLYILFNIEYISTYFNIFYIVIIKQLALYLRRNYCNGQKFNILVYSKENIDYSVIHLILKFKPLYQSKIQ